VKLLISAALLNFEHYLVFTLGLSYTDITLDLRESVTEGAFYERVWSSNYVCYEINSAFIDILYVLNNISKDSFMLTNPGLDISASEGAQTYIRNQLRKVEPTLLGQMKYDSLNIPCLNVPREIIPSVNNKPKREKLGRICLFDLRSQLKCKDVDNKLYPPCTRATSCSWKHIDLKKHSKQALKDYIVERQFPREQQIEMFRGIESCTFIGTRP
jgi:hypothetical protein